ncbi:MAG TPA: serine/threonine-protein kinase [Kofleriaceae bacterium]|nr:serine/threonine-protein kinase [Kofleriaceae bacterium]
MIEVGQVLDKYELLERVGQGGMAVVYRGLDRSLRRTVAVKVLHRHLADHKEARDRFEREAHAVAKLRHENILEIFDYAAGTDDSYIVTEFIEGATLKQFVTDHPPQHAEIGAMVVLQICRALAHAHGQGILHRDVKPENVMIRSDGVVKLTDFGISQMVDLERMTVTGQLLGSPAYMSPEHVEGRPLDFRTDIFAAGIVLYQLTVGKLPFEGKNPHEILKRIGECKFLDPRQANPRVGNELGKIILRAMAREPDERYPDVTAMVGALERYVEGSGLGDPAKELARFFASPPSYEVALQQRLVDHLVRKGKELLAQKQQASALELFDRVLTIEPKNETVLGLLDRMASKRKWRSVAAASAIVIVAIGAWYARRMFTSPPMSRVGPTISPTGDLPGSDGIANVTVPAMTPDAAPSTPMALPDAASQVAITHVHADAHPADAGAAASVTVTVVVSPPDSQVSIAGGAFEAHDGGKVEVEVGEAPVIVAAQNACCETESITITSKDAAKPQLLNLGFLPGYVVAHCKTAGMEVHVNGQHAELDKPFMIPFGRTTQTQKSVTVEFFSKDTGTDTQQAMVTYHQTAEVTCKEH